MLIAPIVDAKELSGCNTKTTHALMIANFETGSLNSGQVGVVPNFPEAKDALVLVHDPVRSGNFALKVTIDKTKKYISAGAYRAEYGTVSNYSSQYNIGDFRIYKFSVYLPEGWEVDSRASIDSVFQFKRFGKGPDMFVAIKGADLVLRTLDSRQDVIVDKIRTGQWIDVCLDVYWSPIIGEVNVFAKYSDEPIYSHKFTFNGPNMIDTGYGNSYLKWGLYKPGYDASVSTRPRVIFMDDIGIYTSH